jgi:hypothetical protein
MNSYEISATVQGQGIVSVAGVPFATGTKVQISISPLDSTEPTPAETNGLTLDAARARMQELFDTVKGFRMSPKISREELYDRRGLH